MTIYPTPWICVRLIFFNKTVPHAIEQNMLLNGSRIVVFPSSNHGLAIPRTLTPSRISGPSSRHSYRTVTPPPSPSCSWPFRTFGTILTLDSYRTLPYLCQDVSRWSGNRGGIPSSTRVLFNVFCACLSTIVVLLPARATFIRVYCM